MRVIKIILLHFLEVFESRSRAFVWFLTTIIYPLLLILFFQGASKKLFEKGWDSASVTSYYLSLTIAFSLLISHIEEGISKIDIKEGMLVMYLLKPLSYFWIKFFEELPYKVLQGFYGLLFCLGMIVLLRRNVIALAHDPVIILLGVLLLSGAMFLSFTLKMILGILTIWFTDIQGLYELVYLLEMIFSGLLMPLVFLPVAVAHTAYILPFSYIVYFPITTLLGHLSFLSALVAFLVQCIWIFAGFSIYQILWKMGVKKFSGVGQ